MLWVVGVGWGETVWDRLNSCNLLKNTLTQMYINNQSVISTYLFGLLEALQVQRKNHDEMWTETHRHHKDGCECF